MSIGMRTKLLILIVAQVEVKHLILMMGMFHFISCFQLPWPTYSSSSASSHKAASNKYFQQNAYSNDGNKEEHSSTTYLDGHNSADDNANVYSGPSLAKLLQPAKMLPYITDKLPVTVDYISPTPTKRPLFGDQPFSFFPTTDLLHSFSLVPKQPLLETLPTIITESLSPVIAIEPVLSVLKKSPSNANQESTGYSDVLNNFNPVDSLTETSSQNSKNVCDDKTELFDFDSVSSESYKINKGSPVFKLLDSNDDDAYLSSIVVSSPDLGDELIFITEEVPKTDEINNDAEVITLLPSALQSVSYDLPVYSYVPNYYYMQPYPMFSIQSNTPSNAFLPAFGFPYDSADMLSNNPIPMNEQLLLYGNLPVHDGMPPYYVQQYPTWPNYYQEANSNSFQGATASASPASATSDSQSRSTSYTTEDFRRF